MKYVIITNKDFELNSFNRNLVKIWLELDARGSIIKEIGWDKNEHVIHVYPSAKFEYGKYGIFDLNAFEYDTIQSDITKNEFYEIWNNQSF